MQEIWADIEGYEGKYMVSNLGRVKSLKDSHGNYREKILNTGNNRKDYLFVNLWINGKRKKYYIHRLVAQTFIPNPDNLPVINHKDENSMNNCVNNLEWCTVKYNNCYGTKLERMSKSKSKKAGCFKEGKLIKVYNSIKDTKKDGFNDGTVCKCCRGKLNSHLGFQFKYI